MITAGIGRFGPYIKHGSTYKSLTAEDDVLTIGANRAVVLLAEPAAERRRGSPQPLRELGTHPDGGVVALFQGRYGPYVSHDGVFASLPREANPDSFSLEQAIPLLEERRKSKPRRQGKSAKRGAAKTATKSSARKPATTSAAASATNGSAAKTKAPAVAKGKRPAATKAKRAASSKTTPAKKKAAAGPRARKSRPGAGSQPG